MDEQLILKFAKHGYLSLPVYTIKLRQDQEGNKYLITGFIASFGRKASPWYYPLCRN